MPHQRPLGLIAIVVYKAFFAVVFMVASVAIFLALKNYEAIAQFAETYTPETQIGFVDWGLDKVLKLDPRTLQFSGLATGIYGAVTAVEAIGLWQQKTWAHFLVITLVGLGIPPEIYELIREASLIKLLVFVINVGVLSYLIYTFPRKEAQPK
ncbi:MAG: DUF2127 domain-containing protein [Timaviella obliquedivisa GSE-PSE-MK23-08B]|jgi:uncharacterized membrane protein|nr:DUF2127 domain-containing protein [Timaviella obliquedivisa GSE-PSE-MK23-08B]